MEVYYIKKISNSEELYWHKHKQKWFASRNKVPAYESLKPIKDCLKNKDHSIYYLYNKSRDIIQVVSVIVPEEKVLDINKLLEEE